MLHLWEIFLLHLWEILFHLWELLQLWEILLHLWELLHLENFITLVGPTGSKLPEIKSGINIVGIPTLPV